VKVVFYNLKERKLNIKDTQMDYISLGKGQKPLILIQGLSTSRIKGLGPLSTLMFRFPVKNYRVFILDRRYELFKGISVKDFAEDIVSAMDALKISNAYVIGLSQEDMIAQYLAINRLDSERPAS